jgi:cytochrome b561
MKIQFQEYLQIALLSMMLTLPVIGFVFGTIRELKANIFGFIGVLLSPIVGISYSISSVINLGKVSLDEAGVNYVNLRVWIVPTFVLLFIFFVLARIYLLKKI